MVGQENNGRTEPGVAVSVLGVPVHAVSMDQVMQTLYNTLETEERLRIVTVNPEMVMWARNDECMARAICAADLAVPDGNGVVWALRRSGYKEQSRIAGVDLVERIFAHTHARTRARACARKGLRVFLIGGRRGIPERAGERIEERWPAVKIVGCRHGYFSVEEEEEIIDEINSSLPDILLVGMGVPRQELWLANHWETMNAKLGVGIGGGLDLWAGKTKRAPRFLQDCGLEWFYRACVEPRRFFRLLALPRFVLEVMREARGGK